MLANSLSIGGALLIVLAIDAVLFMGQEAIHSINPDSQLKFLVSPAIGAYNAGNYTLNQAAPVNNLPSGNPSIGPGDGNLFVDTFTAVWNWISSIPGLNVLFAVLGGPTAYLQELQLPLEFIFAVGAVWYGTTFFLFVAFITGRGG